MKKEENGIFIGSFSSDNKKDVTIGTFKGKNSYSVFVYTNEGNNIDHFHIVPNDGVSKVICVQIKKAVYFPHGTKTGKLNSRDCTALDTFLRSANTSEEGSKYKFTNWQFIFYIWLVAHEDIIAGNEKHIEMLKSYAQPNYTTIADYNKR